MISININTRKLESRLSKLVDLDKIDLALKIGARDIQENAKKIHKYTTRTGNLDNSIITTGKRLEHGVGLDLRTAKYGAHQHDGTKAHFIKPKNGGYLRWAVGGKFYFSKGHEVSGIKKDPFIVRGYSMARKIIIQRIMKAFK